MEIDNVYGELWSNQLDRNIRQFLAIAEAGSITAASRALNVTQPTLTVNMQRLEREVGVPLLVRTNEGVKLTQYGESFRENARMMQRLYDNALITLKEQRERNEHGISLACGYTWWTLFVREQVKSYRLKYPQAPIRVNLGDQIQCMEQLLSGDVSLFVSNKFDGLRESTGAEFLRLSQSGTGYFVRRGHPLLGTPRTRAEIYSFPLAVTAPPENRFRAFMDEAQRLESVASAFAVSRFAFASNSLTACVDYVLDSDAVLPHTQLMSDELQQRGLAEVNQSAAAPPKAVGIYVLSDRLSDEHVARLVEAITATAKAVLPQQLNLG